MVLRTDLADATVMATIHPDQHNEANTQLLATQPLMSRQTATYTTTATTSGARETGVIALGHAYRLSRITTTAACRVRLYTTVANQTADAGRATTTDPPQGAGCILDYVTTSGFMGGDLSPLVDGASMESTPSVDIPITVDLGATGPTVITFTFMQTEV